MQKADNQNPTIVNAADLPTRKPADTGLLGGGGGAAASKKPDIYDGTIFAPSISSYAAALDDPFTAGDGDSSSEEDNEDNVLEEPIDEQEIYGSSSPPVPQLNQPPRVADDKMKSKTQTNRINKTDLIATITDPEHPISLGALAVVSLEDIKISRTLPTNPSSPLRTATVLITPTITHCSLATIIGLGVRVRLEQSLPPRFRLDVRIKEGSHTTADEVTKQLADKERVAAALENGNLQRVIGKMLETC